MGGKHAKEKDELKQQFRDLGQNSSKGTVKKRDLCGDPRYRTAKNIEDIKQLKKEDLEKTRERTRKIAFMIRDCQRQRKSLVEMQKLIGTVDGSVHRKREAAEEAKNREFKGLGLGAPG